MKSRDVMIILCAIVVMFLGGSFFLKQYIQNENSNNDVSKMIISKYTAEHLPYIEVDNKMDNIKKEYTTMIRGVEYCGKLDDVFYLNTIDEICANYMCDDGTSFDVDLSKDKVIAVYFKHNKDENKEVISDEKKETIATECAKEFIDIENYRVEIDKSGSGICYIFTRYVGEFKTCEEVRVFVKETGYISTIWTVELGEFDNVSLEGADDNKSEETLAEKIKKDYGEKSEYEVNDKFLIKTQKNEIAMLYNIDLTKENGMCERDFFIVLWE